ncbi:MAG: hypothetical protein QOG64_3149, partial [Acidimicrobiaceae bacterium]|nr:hypothetical protein [Acidimicrobiaceae bacterium]
RALVAGAGETVGLHLLSVVGALAVALAAWALATEADPKLARAAFWIAATSPALVNGTIVWAHSLSAALAGGAVLAAVRIGRRGLRAGDAAALAGCLVGGVLIRSEGLLVAVALVLVLGVVRLVRAGVRAGMAAAVVAGLPALLAVEVENRWKARLIGMPASMRGVRQDSGSYLTGRVTGVWHDFLSPHYLNARTGLIGSVALAVIVFGAILWRRQGPQARGERDIAVALLVGMAVMVVNAVVSPGGTVTGLLAAWPLLLVGLVMWRWRPASEVERMAMAIALLVGLGVAATTYPDGAGLNWGGRFLSPAIVPLAVVAAGALRRALLAKPARARIELTAVLVVVALVPALIGLASVRIVRSNAGAYIDEVVAAGAPVVVTDESALPRAAWRAPNIAWLLVPPDEVADALGRLRDSGFPRVAVIEGTDLPASALQDVRSVSTVPAPRLRRAGYSVLVVAP